MSFEETIHWTEICQRMESLREHGPFVLDPNGTAFEGSGVRLIPPLLVPLPPSLQRAFPPPDESVRERVARLARESGAAEQGDPLEAYAASIPSSLPRHAVVLLQAGASAAGYFVDGDPVATKSSKRYVIRGNGRAQPAFLKTKGKSRYGSRLRLQNARRMVGETNEKLAQFWDEHGPPERIFVNAPARMWTDLFLGKPAPPFGSDQPIVRIPLDLPRPTTATVLRAYTSLGYGKLILDRPAP